MLALLFTRQRYARAWLLRGNVLDVGSNYYPIVPDAVSLDLDLRVQPAIQASGLILPFHSCVFDNVVCLELIEHFDRADQFKLIGELLRVLKPSGIIAVSTPNVTYATQRIHDWLWFISHFVYARETLGTHILELKGDMLERLFLASHITIRDVFRSQFQHVVVGNKIDR